jgi:hypothetical protein
MTTKVSWTVEKIFPRSHSSLLCGISVIWAVAPASANAHRLGTLKIAAPHRLSQNQSSLAPIASWPGEMNGN